jgi:hypothetical protein
MTVQPVLVLKEDPVLFFLMNISNVLNVLWAMEVTFFNLSSRVSLTLPYLHERFKKNENNSFDSLGKINHIQDICAINASTVIMEIPKLDLV